MEELALNAYRIPDSTQLSGTSGKNVMVSPPEGTSGRKSWGALARARGCLKKGDELDYTKASGILFDDFRSGKIGRVTLEWAE